MKDRQKIDTKQLFASHEIDQPNNLYSRLVDQWLVCSIGIRSRRALSPGGFRHQRMQTGELGTPWESW